MNRIHRLLSTAAAVASLGILVSSFAYGTTIVAPNSLAATEGNVNNAFPFDNFQILTRYQQIYSVSEFASVTGPISITSIAFRPDGAFGSIAGPIVINGLNLDLSSTTVAVDGLNTNYLNHGGDQMSVFNGNLLLQTFNTGIGPRNFDIVINFQNAFIYDPTLGNNLLLDFTIPIANVNFLTYMDAHGAIDGISRVYTRNLGGAVTVMDSIGLVTQFTYSEIEAPEPSVLALLGGFGLLAGWVALRRR